MSPHAVNTFVSDLVHMAQAMERLPLVEKELIEALDRVEIKEQYIQQLQHQRIDQANVIEGLKSTIASLEGQRDDAELRFLIADDRAGHAIKALRDVAGSLGVTISIIDPRPEAQAVEPVIEGPSADPLPLGENATSVTASTTIQPIVEPIATQDGKGVSSEGAPTVNTPGSLVHVSPIVSSDNATTGGVFTSLTEPVSVQPHPTEASADPVPLPSGVSSNEGAIGEGSVPANPTLSANIVDAGTVTTVADAHEAKADGDPEPLPRYTWAWYQWRDRTIEDRVKDGLPAVSSASHYS